MRVLRAEWSVEQLFSEALSQLKEQIGDPVSEDDGVYRWHRSNRISEKSMVLDRSEGSLEMEVSVPEYLKYLLVALTLSSVVGVVSGYQLFVEMGAVGAVVLYLVFNDFVDVPRAEGFEITSIRIAPVYFVSLGVAFFAVLPSQYSGEGVLQFVYVVAVLFILGQHFAEGSLPVDSKYVPEPGQSQSYLLIPVLGLAAPVGSYVLFNVFALFRQWPIPVSVVVTAVSVLSLASLWAFGAFCRDTIWKIRRDQNKAFDSQPIQVLSLLLYLVLNAVSLVVLVFFVDIVSLGLRDEAVVQNLNESGIELFAGVFANLDSVFEVLPWVAPRTGSVLFFGVVFLPTIFLIGIWILHLCLNLGYKLYLLWAAEPVDVDIDGGEDVSIVSLDTGKPVIKPVTMFFGLKRMIVVDESVLNKLDQDRNELQALLAHELYHLRNREQLVNILSSILAIGFIGGKNAVLSFYNYPDIEQRADDDAAGKYGAEALQVALRKVKSLQSNKAVSSLISPTAYPGLVRSQSEETKQNQSKEENPTLDWLQGVMKDFAAPYQLFYGSVLFDEAHQQIDDRIDRIVSVNRGLNE